MIESPSLQLLRRELLDPRRDAISEFEKRFSSEIESFLFHLHLAFTRLEALGELRAIEPVRPGMQEEDLPLEDRRYIWVQLFLHAALNNLLVSTHFLISCYLVPAGNLMRHFGESVAMAVLCAHQQAGIFEEFLHQGQKYPVQKALDQLRRRRIREMLKLNSEAVERLDSITKWYDSYSHSSRLAVQSLVVLGKETGIIVGSQFDEGKEDAYTKEMAVRVSDVLPANWSI